MRYFVVCVFILQSVRFGFVYYIGILNVVNIKNTVCVLYNVLNNRVSVKVIHFDALSLYTEIIFVNITN